MTGDGAQWIEVTALVEADDSDLVAAALTDAGAQGAVIEPVLLISDDADFAYEERRDRRWVVRAYFAAPFEAPARRRLRHRLDRLDLPGGLGRLHYAAVEPQDWSETWKQFYTLQRIGRLVIRPSWEPYEAAPGEVVVDLDPGAAFGTGQHETTRLCLAALSRHMTEGMTVLDVGAGSGILAVAAALLGSAEVLAVDVDASTVPVVLENAERNGVASRITAAAGSLGDEWPWPGRPPEELADVVVANISSTVLVRLMPGLVRAIRPGGLLIASGFIQRNAPEVTAAAAAAGLSERALEVEGDWCCLVAQRGDV
jgi:ribosomal protein L11 methyltransferase